jgi:hypothetical protein
MPYLEEIKIAAVLLAVIASYVFFIQPRLRAKKQVLLERYLQVQSTSLNMQDLILNYVLKHDAMRNNVLPGVTFKDYLRDLQKKHSAYLSDKQYKKLKKQNVLLFALWINGMLDKQEERLEKVKNELSQIQASFKANAPKGRMAAS